MHADDYSQKFMDNYMVIICSVIVVQLFYAILNFKQNETKFSLMALKANEKRREMNIQKFLFVASK